MAIFKNFEVAVRKWFGVNGVFAVVVGTKARHVDPDDSDETEGDVDTLYNAKLSVISLNLYFVMMTHTDS